MSHETIIAQKLNIRPRQVTAVIDMLDEGNTIPFIARYRKEATGELDEEQLRLIHDDLGRLRTLDERRETILTAIDEQEKLTPELKSKIQAAGTLTLLEDLYQPYKKKRQTRAEVARKRGLEPLAQLIIKQGESGESITQLARPFLSEEVVDAEAAWAGARDIVAEMISDHPDVRGPLREKALQFARLAVSKRPDAEDPREIFKLYYEFEQRVDRLRPHQILAINRGENEKVLKVSVEIAPRDWLRAIASRFLPRRTSTFFKQLDEAIHDAAQRLLLPAIERDVRRTLTETAESHAIQVFAQNLRGLLTQPPLADQIVLALDPGYRTGCKIAVVDATGKVLDHGAIYPHAPQKRWDESLEKLKQWVTRFNVTLIAIGNGTASRESEQLAAELIGQLQESGYRLSYLIVNEAGASVYSASPLARAEMPDLDVTIRGAVSIGRRVLDPLAELVKIDPKSIGVGMYQHDVNQKSLAASLDGVVESVVNQVGVDVNSASPALLTYVSGIGPKLAETIVAHRDANGPFDTRTTLNQVKGLGPKAFEQSAGFLRIRGGENWLDGSAIHPESYHLATQITAQAGLNGRMDVASRENALSQLEPEKVAAALQAGVPTVRDIFEQLIRPGRDPREDLPAPILRQDVLSMQDLKVGMRLKGTVRNVVDFGAFVDIGVKQDGLVHRSRLPRGLALSVGDVIDIEIISLEIERGRIGLGYVS
ncbi:MAG: Tex family protein [Ardenticatenaceae bacterium]|nr:Tex family protein [Ardenticatenaceae bacterium]